MTKITQNPHKIPLVEEMIPIITQGAESNSIRVLVDGYLATCCLGDFGTHSTRLQLIFELPHPKWGEILRTKYYIFVEPGKLELRTHEIVDIYKLV